MAGGTGAQRDNIGILSKLGTIQQLQGWQDERDKNKDRSGDDSRTSTTEVVGSFGYKRGGKVRKRTMGYKRGGKLRKKSRKHGRKHGR